MRMVITMVAAAVAVLLGTTPVAAQTYPKFTGLVVDAANVLPPETEADLTAKLQALQKDTNRQLVVATIPDLQGYPLEEYGIGLLRAWGVGLKDVNNGAILFIAPNEPKGHRGPRIEVGYGLEPFLTDAFSGSVIRGQMMPKLTQSGDIAGAMEAGTDALIAQLRASPEEAKARTDAAIAEFNRTHPRRQEFERRRRDSLRPDLLGVRHRLLHPVPLPARHQRPAISRRCGARDPLGSRPGWRLRRQLEQRLGKQQRR